MAVVTAGVEEGQQLEELRALHEAFVAERPAWVERIEVVYVDRDVLRTLTDRPRGRIAVVCPGEPLHVRDAGFESTLDWHGVTTQGETILGPPPLELGPQVTSNAFRHAVEALLREWPSRVRAPWVAYVPAHQGYVVMTLCRALYALATGEQTTKEEAAAWAAARYPEWSSFISEARQRPTAPMCMTRTTPSSHSPITRWQRLTTSSDSTPTRMGERPHLDARLSIPVGWAISGGINRGT